MTIEEMKKRKIELGYTNEDLTPHLTRATSEEPQIRSRENILSMIISQFPMSKGQSS